MMRRLIIAALSAATVAFATAAVAQQASFGTAAEAKAMLEKAIVAVKADKGKALEMFNKGEGGFKDRDLYPFCFNISDGKAVASLAPVLGIDVRTLKDKTGHVFGEDVYNAAKDGQITEVSYMLPRPGSDPTPVQKISFVTKVDDLGCGVGYYK
jgi:Single Cache domain 2